MYGRYLSMFKFTLRNPTNLQEELAARTKCNAEVIRDAVQDRKGARSLLEPKYRIQLREEVGDLTDVDQDRGKALCEQVMIEQCRAKSFKPY